MDVTELRQNSPVRLGPARLSAVFEAAFFLDSVTAPFLGHKPEVFSPSHGSASAGPRGRG